MPKGPGHCPPAWRLKGGDETHLRCGTGALWDLLALEVHGVPQGVPGGLWVEPALLQGASWGITEALGSTTAGITMGCDPRRDLGLFGL